jgi:hypothetical protein
VWYSTDEVMAAGQEKAKELDQQKQRATAEADTNEVNKRQHEAEKDALTRKLQNANGVRARGLMDRIQKAVKAAADKPTTGKVRRATETQRDFPSFSAWLNRRFDELWETTGVLPEIMDFGIVQWKDRAALDAIIVRIEVKQDNRIQGVHETSCFVFGLVEDLEFSMERDPFDAECGSSERTIAAWKARRQFKSLWNAE